MSGFAQLLADVRTRVDAALGDWLAPRVASAASISAEVGAAAEAARDLSLRGGKRLRAALVGVGHQAFAGAARDDVVPAMIAIELLQTYLLIHDDWMDDDDVRRGGPSVHMLLRKRFGSKELGDTGAVLAGDLASGWAQEALLSCAPAIAPERVLRAAKAYARINIDVVTGQLAEMGMGAGAGAPEAAAQAGAKRPESSRAVSGVGVSGAKPLTLETVHALKTASYTVTGPLLVGAALGGADEASAAGLERYGRPLGIAFQLRDDLLGTFGDPVATGKPVWNDIRQGKRTALVAELLRDEAGAAAWAHRADVEGVVRAMETTGAKARVEARVRELCDEARAALDALAPTITEPGRLALEGAVRALGERAS
ncbi:MAG: polyprenyl synthetase family protein [Labilithrix sp.]|nr:polyprenyl synthetase family protein [Labilithrix sp.]MCW5813745.1 polyprenyl synthetase family protein [Labilithrix sp.]